MRPSALEITAGDFAFAAGHHLTPGSRSFGLIDCNSRWARVTTTCRYTRGGGSLMRVQFRFCKSYSSWDKISQAAANFASQLPPDRLINTFRTRATRRRASSLSGTKNPLCRGKLVPTYGDQKPKKICFPVTMRGDVPISVDGRSSVTRRKTTKPTASSDLKQSAAA
jgi:hypothetical protein